jgi:Fructose-2,6-bisphosphatase
MTIIMLVRHGNNNFLGKRLAGRLPDVHLNEEGKQQAVDVAHHLTRYPIKAIFSSPLERAVETAQPFAQMSKLPVQIEPDLLELDFGDFQGCEIKYLEQQEMWNLYRSQPTRAFFPGAVEKIAEAQNRVANCISRIAAQYESDDRVVCFTHGDVVRLSTAHFLNMSLDDYVRFRTHPGSITEFRITPERIMVTHFNQIIEHTLSEGD